MKKKVQQSYSPGNGTKVKRKTHYPYPMLAEEGWLFMAVILIITVFTLVLNLWLGVFFSVISAFVVQFFRDPKRYIPPSLNLEENARNILAPADGRIVSIEPCFDVYQNKQALKISIFMNVFNPHSNRSPVDGKVISKTYIPGNFVNAQLDKSSEANERNALVIALPNESKITVVQIAGLIARRILCYADVGEALTRGQRYGFIRFGSRVDVYLPLNSRSLVRIGQKVKATETILALAQEDKAT